MVLGTIVRLTERAREETYSDYDWKDDRLEITSINYDNDGEKLYSFNSSDINKEVTCSLYSYEFRIVQSSFRGC